MSARVLVTGDTGAVGRQVVAALARRGHDVRRAGGRARADLLRPGAAAALVAAERPTHLVHLAWEVADQRATAQRPWVEATAALLEAFAASPGARRAVVAGSCAEYDWSAGRCVEASTPLRPATPYGEAKRAAGAAALALDLPVAWARVFFAFGPGEAPGRLVPTVARAALARRPVALSAGTQRRDWLPTGEVGDALAALVTADVEGAVNVGSGRAVAVAELARLVAAAADAPAELLRLGERPGPPEPPLVVADVARLRDEVGWTPSRSLEAGVADAVAWWRAHRPAD